MDNKTVLREVFYQELIYVLEEAFDTHYGIFLDKDTSLFATLGLISAEEASLPIGDQCASIAAQVEHVIYYLEVMVGFIQGQEMEVVDWGDIWSRVEKVTDDEWLELKSRLEESYVQLKVMLQGIEDWEQNHAIGASIGIVAHTAYHLGEIRQALCFIGHSRVE
jgi:hypothetical protein